MQAPAWDTSAFINSLHLLPTSAPHSHLQPLHRQQHQQQPTAGPAPGALDPLLASHVPGGLPALKTLYSRFISGPNFGPWFRERRRGVDQISEGERSAALAAVSSPAAAAVANLGAVEEVQGVEAFIEVEQRLLARQYALKRLKSASNLQQQAQAAAQQQQQEAAKQQTEITAAEDVPAGVSTAGAATAAAAKTGSQAAVAQLNGSSGTASAPAIGISGVPTAAGASSAFFKVPSAAGASSALSEVTGAAATSGPLSEVPAAAGASSALPDVGEDADVKALEQRLLQLFWSLKCEDLQQTLVSSQSRRELLQRLVVEPEQVQALQRIVASLDWC